MNLETINTAGETIISSLKAHPSLLILLIAWIIFWKVLAMWKAAKNNHLTIFIILAVINTVGIFEIIYLLYLYFKGKKEDTLM